MHADGGPLDGVRVLDLAGVEAELTGRTLAELGADVLKVEPPEGAVARRRPPFDERSRESLYWAAVGAGKASLVLDLASDEGRARLAELVVAADVMVESFRPGTTEAWDLGPQRLAALNPALVHVSVTAYGSTGPKAGWPATELTAEAASGRMVSQVDGDRPPIPIGHPQAYYHAGVQAAADAVVALVERQRSGAGQHLDVSVQAVMVHTLFGSVSGALLDPEVDADAEAAGLERRARRLELLPDMWECADGFVAAPLGAGALPLAEHIMGELAAEGPLDPAVAAIDWPRLAADVLRGRCDDDVVRAALELLAGWFRRHTKAELYRLAHEGDFRMGPLLTTADLVADPHLAARGFWSDIGGRTHPGPAVRPLLFDRPPAPAPALGEDRGRPLAWAEATEGRPASAPPAGPRTGSDGRRPGALSGLKVADFSWVAVGPTIGRALADHGATVVRVESSKRTDVARVLPPFKGDAKGIDDSHWYAHFNAGKLGLSLNLGTAEGRQVASGWSTGPTWCWRASPPAPWPSSASTTPP